LKISKFSLDGRELHNSDRYFVFVVTTVAYIRESKSLITSIESIILQRNILNRDSKTVVLDSSFKNKIRDKILKYEQVNASVVDLMYLYGLDAI